MATLLLLTRQLTGVAAGDEPSSDQSSDQSPDPLEQARAQLAAGDLEAAVATARALIAIAPGRGAAHLVLGLALFRAGRYDESLAAFEAARTSAVPAAAGPTVFNEGAALFALGRYAQARASFERAAGLAPELAFLATVNAAEAAISEGELARARQLATAASGLATTDDRRQMSSELNAHIEEATTAGRVRTRSQRRDEARAALAGERFAQAASLYQDLLADVAPAPSEAERNLYLYGLGLARFRQQRYAEASQSFAQAAALDPTDGDSLFMQALATQDAGHLTAARALFRQALRRGLDGETATTARTHLDRLSFGARGGGAGVVAGVGVGNGYDSNVIQGGDARPEAITADQVGSAGAYMVTAEASVGYAWLRGRTGFLAADYAFDQLAYPDADHEAYSLQDHSLRLRGEWSPSDFARLGLLAGEELQFTGLDSFQPYQNVVTIEPGLAVDELPSTSTNLRVRGQWKTALDPDYAYFGGTRLDVRLGQRVRWKALRGELAFRHRRERIGVRTATLLQIGTAQTFKFRKRKPTDPVDQASYVYVAPYSYDSNALLAGFEVSLGRLRLTADGAAEILDFRGVSQVFFVATTMNVNRLYQSQDRRDLHVTGSLALAASISKHVELVLRYDVTDNRSTLVLDVDNRNYWKHMVALAVEADW